MMTYEKLSKRPSVFSRLAGVTVEEFEELHDVFASFWQQFVIATFIKGKERKRAYGGGNTPRMETTQDKLLFILTYVRLYSTQLLQGFWFNIDESAFRNIKEGFADTSMLLAVGLHNIRVNHRYA